MYGGWLPAALMVLAALGVGAAMLAMASLLGPRRADAAKAAPYECGVPLFQDARERFPVKFYLVGVLFLLFDLETLFLIPWAVTGRELGWSGVLAGALFLGVLGAGLAYAWGRGVLDWSRE